MMGGSASGKVISPTPPPHPRSANLYKFIRQVAGSRISDQSLAKRCGVKIATINQMRAGHCPPTASLPLYYAPDLNLPGAAAPNLHPARTCSPTSIDQRLWTETHELGSHYSMPRYTSGNRFVNSRLQFRLIFGRPGWAAICRGLGEEGYRFLCARSQSNQPELRSAL